jgi:hypothetical protein
VHDSGEVYDGVPSLHDAKATELIAKLHWAGCSARWDILPAAPRTASSAGGALISSAASTRNPTETAPLGAPAGRRAPTESPARAQAGGSNFAIVMERELAGGNHKAVTIRGTEFSSGQDWLTNFNIGLKLGAEFVALP